jgi:hypothetical protein
MPKNLSNASRLLCGFSHAHIISPATATATTKIPGWFSQNVQLPDNDAKQKNILLKRMQQDDFDAHAILVVAIIIILLGLFELCHHLRKRT